MSVRKAIENFIWMLLLSQNVGPNTLERFWCCSFIWAKNVLTYLFQCFSRSLVQFRWRGGWGFGGLCLMRNALKALNPGIHAVWLWANGLLFQKCQGGLFLYSKISRTFLKESGFHKNKLYIINFVFSWRCDLFVTISAWSLRHAEK